MSRPLLGDMGGEEGQGHVTLLVSSPSSTMGSVCLDRTKLKERNYMGLSDCSLVDSPTPSFSDESKINLNLKATELRLGLPGSQSPERDSDLNLRSSTQLYDKPLFSKGPATEDHHSSAKPAVLGNKRGFSDAMNGFSEEKLLVSSEVNKVLPSSPSPNSGSKDKAKEVATAKGSSNNDSIAQATKAQVVGWPPIRSFRKNSLATTVSKNSEEVDGKTGSGALLVKVSMDGAPYLRKVDLKNYSAYSDLSSALEKMFGRFLIGQCGSHENLGKEMMSETKLKNLLRGTEYVLTYDDKDGDWMVVGDVPWEMFIDTCRRLRIMKSADAIGLAPRAVEKSRS